MDVAVLVGGISGQGECTGSKRGVSVGEVIIGVGRATVILDAVLFLDFHCSKIVAASNYR